MIDAPPPPPSRPALPGLPSRSEWRQVAGVVRLELKRHLFSRRAFWLVLPAGFPVFAFTMDLLSRLLRGRGGPADAEALGRAMTMFAEIFQVMYLHLVLLFTCLILFSKLFKAEVADQTLHLYFLCPVRRSLVVLGKFLAGALGILLLTGVSVTLSYVLNLGHFGGRAIVLHLFQDGEIGHLLAYLGILLLGGLAYGALFLVFGLHFKNPILPGIVFFFWEGFHYILPPSFQALSATYYLRSLMPIQVMEDSPFAILVDPASVWRAVPSLVLAAAAFLALAMLLAHRKEVRYGAEQ